MIRHHIVFSDYISDLEATFEDFKDQFLKLNEEHLSELCKEVSVTLSKIYEEVYNR